MTSLRERFEITDKSFQVAFDEAIERLSRHVMRACATHDGWPRKVRAGIEAALEFAVAEPAAMRLIVVDSLAPAETAKYRNQSILWRFEAQLRLGREQGAAPAELPSVTEEALLGAIAGTILKCLLAGQDAGLPELAPQLVEVTLLPYLGPAAARRVASGPAPFAT